MQQYRWKAVNGTGQSFSGVCSAASEGEAAAFVRSNYGYLTFLQREKAKTAFTFGKWQSKCRLTDEERAVFFSQLALMLNSGLPVLKALSVLEERLPQKTARLCRDLQDGLQNGESLAGCVNNSREAWGSLAAAVIAAGEAGGILCEMLDELAQYYQLQAQMKRFIKNISLYPLFLLTASLAVALVFIVKVLPLFADLYASMNAAVPPYLNLLFALQGALADNLPAFLFTLLAVLFLAVRQRGLIRQALFAVPFLKTQKQLYLEIRFCKVLALLARAAELLQIRFDDTLKKLKVVLEPLLLLFVAAFVSAIILAVAAPMFSLSGAMPEY